MLLSSSTFTHELAVAVSRFHVCTHIRSNTKYLHVSFHLSTNVLNANEREVLILMNGMLI